MSICKTVINVVFLVVRNNVIVLSKSLGIRGDGVSEYLTKSVIWRGYHRKYFLPQNSLYINSLHLEPKVPS